MKKNKGCIGRINKFMALVVCVALLYGCSINHAAQAPTPLDYKQVKLGASRTETIALLGFPKLTDQKDNKKVDLFDLFDGYHSATKARIILYVAGDLLTIGLSEIIFWPIESGIFDGQKCRGSVAYDVNDLVTGYEFLDVHGKHLWFSPPTASSKEGVPLEACTGSRPSDIRKTSGYENMTDDEIRIHGKDHGFIVCPESSPRSLSDLADQKVLK
ncbi:MAG: hypothetical protein Q8L15_17495 [Methylobacter sp.]|nr:hypothetical protein [Methylobacter sp.]